MFEAIQTQLATSITCLTNQGLALTTEMGKLRQENLNLQAVLAQHHSRRHRCSTEDYRWHPPLLLGCPRKKV